jgi:hypothetical protein
MSGQKKNVWNGYILARTTMSNTKRAREETLSYSLYQKDTLLINKTTEITKKF